MEWKVGDWVVFDLSIGQIKELRGEKCASFLDGTFETSGQLMDRFRPLTLRNKTIVESFAVWYNRLHEIDGEAGFNYPRISEYFYELALNSIDSNDSKEFYEKARQFVDDAKAYKPIIQGIHLFRPK